MRFGFRSYKLPALLLATGSGKGGVVDRGSRNTRGAPRRLRPVCPRHQLEANQVRRTCRISSVSELACSRHLRTPRRRHRMQERLYIPGASSRFTRSNARIPGDLIRLIAAASLEEQRYSLPDSERASGDHRYSRPRASDAKGERNHCPTRLPVYDTVPRLAYCISLRRSRCGLRREQIHQTLGHSGVGHDEVS